MGLTRCAFIGEVICFRSALSAARDPLTPSALLRGVFSHSPAKFAVASAGRDGAYEIWAACIPPTRRKPPYLSPLNGRAQMESHTPEIPHRGPACRNAKAPIAPLLRGGCERYAGNPRCGHHQSGDTIWRVRPAGNNRARTSGRGRMVRRNPAGENPRGKAAHGYAGRSLSASLGGAWPVVSR